MPSLKINAPDGKTLRVNIPQGTDPSKYDSIAQDALDDYSKTSPQPDNNDPSKLGSFARGVMSGVPGAETVVSGLESLDPNKTYEQAHSELEAAKDKDWDVNPVSYGAGKATGIVGTGIVAPASIPGAIGVGALSGIDAATKLSDAPAAALKGGAEGAVLGTIGEKVVSPALDKIGEMLPSLGKRTVASLGSKTTLDNVESYLQNPEAIRNGLTKPEIGEKIAEATGDVGTAASHLSGMAREELNPANNPLNMDSLKSVFRDVADKYSNLGGPATGADETALKTLQDQFQRLGTIAQKNNGNVPEDTLRAMIDRLQAATKDSVYGNPDASASQQALKELSGKLNDALRQANPDYAAAMAPSAEAAGLSSDLSKQFALDDGKATDATFKKVGNILQEGKTEGADLLDKLKGLTGQDFIQALKDSDAASNFNAPGSGGALKTFMTALGYGSGKVTGVPFGGIGGAAVGRYVAEGMNGGHIAKQILDSYMGASQSWENSAVRPLVQKFGPILVDAAKQGGNQLAATHFVLATSNPEYQALTGQIQGNSTNDSTGSIKATQ